MKRKPFTEDEWNRVVIIRAVLSNQMRDAGYAEDDSAAAALCHNQAIRTVLQERKRLGSQKGGNSNAETFDRPDLDDLIRGCLNRHQPTTDYVQPWAEEFGLSRSTIYRRIKKINEKIKAQK